jgi:DNA-binding NtrC family response regulator
MSSIPYNLCASIGSIEKAEFLQLSHAAVAQNVIRLHNICTMETTIVVLTKDSSLGKELSRSFPRDFKVKTAPPEAKSACIFLDTDTMGIGPIRELSERHVVITVTRMADTDPVIEATAAGAYEVLTWPLDRDKVSPMLQELAGCIDEMKSLLPLTVSSHAVTSAIVGRSPLILETCKRLARLSQVDTPVLLTGETGVGKEPIAEALAQLSSRFGKPFVVINCAAVPETLLESELFGFEKGSFTGAVAAKDGMLKIADGGTVFFDEIGELPLSLQGKLLRFLQSQTFYPLGSTKEVRVDVRVVSATNRDLHAMVEAGTFRQDLFHRLRVTSLYIPPLRERKGDILPLVQFFVERYRHIGSRPIKGVTEKFIERLLLYDWPGNIRELENTIRSAIAFCRTPYLTSLELRELGRVPLSGKKATISDPVAAAILPLVEEALARKDRNIYDKIRREVDRVVLDYVLSHSGDNQSEAARLLGINRLTLKKKLNQ